MAQVYFTVDADMQMGRTSGLRARVRRAVGDVLEAALEVARLGTVSVHKDAPLIVRVGAFLVTYSIDVEQASATVWGAEPAREVAA